MKVVVAAFNQDKALVGAFSVITNLCVDLRRKLFWALQLTRVHNAVILTGGEEGEGDSQIVEAVLNWLESNSYRALLVKYFYNYWVPNSG